MYLNYREFDSNIIIIGAGIAGLSAAYKLLEKDPHIDFLVLDVDDKFDRSIRKDSSSKNIKWSGSTAIKKKTKFYDEEIQTDYHFILSEQTNLMNLLQMLDIKIIPTDTFNGNILIDYDELYGFSTRDNISDFFTSLEKKSFNYFCEQIDHLCTANHDKLSEYDDISMNVLLHQLIASKKIRDVISQSFLFNTGLQPNDVSAAFFLTYCNSTQGIATQFIWKEGGIHKFCIESGVENLRRKMIKLIGEEYIVKIPEISEIACDDFCVGIRTKNEYFFANKIVFTLNEMETNNITFIPPLSEGKRLIASNFVRGTLKKFMVNYSEPFWTEKNLSGEVYVMNTDKRNGPVHFCLNVSEVAYNNYTLAGLAEKDSDKVEILNQLVLYFGEEAMNPVNYIETSSSFHELSFPYGCISMKYFENIQNDTERIVWASPETAKDWYGTAAGSIEAGYRGAIIALEEAKPNTLSLDDLNIIHLDEVYIPPRAIGNKWHILIPTLLLVICALIKVKGYLSKKMLK